MIAAGYLPTLSRARADGLTAAKRGWMVTTDLLTGEPEEQVPLAVVIIEARVLRRSVEERQIQLPEQLVDGLATDVPPPPADWSDVGRHSYLLERHARITDCVACELTKGRVPCTVCGTRGKLLVGSGDNQRMITCSPCNGSGHVTCSTCDGAGNALWVRVMHLHDEVTALRYAYVPSMLDELDLAVGERFDTLPEMLPEALRFDPSPRARQSAYRGEVGEADHTFHGHGFGDALSRAMTAVQGLSGSATVVQQEVKAYAWPLLWLRYQGVVQKGEVALLTSPRTGELEAIVV